MLFKKEFQFCPRYDCKVISKATIQVLQYCNKAIFAWTPNEELCLSTWKTNEPFHVGLTKSGAMHHGENNLRLLNYMLEEGDSSVRMQARWNHLLTPVSNVTATADRQKIQMNALFLPGLERSWWRGVLSGSCWLLASWDCSTVEGHSVCCIGRIKLLKVSLWCNPRWPAVPPEPRPLCLSFAS